MAASITKRLTITTQAPTGRWRGHSWDSTEDDARKRAKQCALVKRMIDEYYPEAVWSPKGSLV